MECDYSFLDNEDFGLAKSFSTAPVLNLDPHINLAQKKEADLEHELTNEMNDCIVEDGFCFKLAPGQNVRINQVFT